MLIKAAAEVIKRFPEARFVIVGESRSASDRYGRELRELVSKLGLKDRFTFSGWSDDIKQLIADFDVFVSASRSESFGYAIADAMLSGVPVVATETEGAKEIISDPSFGTVVPIDSSDAMAEAIIGLLQEKNRRGGMALAARKHVGETFSIERMIDETESIYRRAVTSGE